jgi:hypothetical protein
VHPSSYESVEFDEGNEAELAAHDVTPDEVLQVLDNDPEWRPNRRERSGDWKLKGFTHGGRSLTIILRWYEDRRLIRPITGWPTTGR